MNASELLKGFAMKKFYDYLDKDPEKNFPKMLDMLEKQDGGRNTISPQIGGIRRFISDPDGNWAQLIKSLWTDIDSHQRRKLVENVVINGTLLGTPKVIELQEKYQCNIPWVIIMDPTSACNLKCTGCWASEYGDKMSLSFEEMDDIVKQGKALGTYVYLFTGGEPLVRKDDVIKLCEKHNDCGFLSFTNGTLIDEAFADEMLRVGNFIPAISIEGFEEATDSRRGKGTYQRAVKAMQILKEKKLLFGISNCYTRANTEVIGSEEYFDHMIDLGAKFSWFFTYMPVGNDAVPDLIVTAEQRKYMYEQINKFRKTKPFFTMDFWNDGDAVGGCIAGGRGYLHISANGDIEPCAFVHYSDSNIREKTLLEAYKSPLFMEYRNNQPFSENMLRPCPVLDNKFKLAEMVEKTNAKSTDLSSPETAREYCAKCVEAADNWEKVADEIWNSLPKKRGPQLEGRMCVKRDPDYK